MRSFGIVLILAAFANSAPPNRFETHYSELDRNLALVIDQHLQDAGEDHFRPSRSPPSLNLNRAARLLLANPSPVTIRGLARYSLVKVLEVYEAARQQLHESQIQLVDTAIESLATRLTVVENEQLLDALPSVEEVQQRLKVIAKKIEYHSLHSGSMRPELTSIEHEMFGALLANLMHALVLDNILTADTFVQVYKDSANVLQNQITPKLSSGFHTDQAMILKQTLHALEMRYDTYMYCAQPGKQADCIEESKQLLASMREVRRNIQ